MLATNSRIVYWGLAPVSSGVWRRSLVGFGAGLQTGALKTPVRRPQPDAFIKSFQPNPNSQFLNPPILQLPNHQITKLLLTLLICQFFTKEQFLHN